MPDERTLPRARRFSLATLLLVPFVLSPLLLSFRGVSGVFTKTHPGWGIHIFLLAMAYTLVLTWVLYRRRTTGQAFVARRPFYWSLVRGVVFGIVFFGLLALPVAIAQEIAFVQKHWFLYSVEWPDRLLRFAQFFMGIAIFGSVFGGAAGGILGLFLPRPSEKQNQEHSE